MMPTNATNRRRRGQAVLEMALVLPLFLVVVMIIYDLGIGLHLWTNLNQAVVAAARDGSKRFIPHYQVYRYARDPDCIPRTFFDNLSPLMTRTNFYAGYNPKFEVITDTASKAVAIRVVAKYRHTLVTPIIATLIGEPGGEGTLVIAAEAEEKLN